MNSSATFLVTIDEDARRRFESAWVAGRAEPIESFLPPSDHPRYRATLEELVLLDLEYRWKEPDATAALPAAGVASALVEEYLTRFPSLNEPRTVLRLLRQEFQARRQHAAPPSWEDYQRRFPQLVTSREELESTLPHKQKAIVPPPDIPGYELLGELGRGGMGVVFKARQIALQRIVALKLVATGALADAQDRERFQREAEAAAALQHPNIVQVFEVGQHAGWPYLALEFVGGGSLAARVGAQAYRPDEAARLVATLARAVHWTHLRGVIHRDLKPANVLLTEDGAPKIADFGLARNLAETSGVTRTGDMLGTPAYMAPEQASGRSHQAGPEADVYALGAILYELLTGRPPFRGANSFETAELVLHHDPEPPRRTHPAVPRDLETICLKCLRKEPGRRYATAGELADDLDRLLKDEPIRARRAGLFEVIWKRLRRRPAVAALFLLCPLLIVTTALALRGWPVGGTDANLDRSSPPPVKDKPKHAHRFVWDFDGGDFNGVSGLGIALAQAKRLGREGGSYLALSQAAFTKCEAAFQVDAEALAEAKAGRWLLEVVHRDARGIDADEEHVSQFRIVFNGNIVWAGNPPGPYQTLLANGIPWQRLRCDVTPYVRAGPNVLRWERMPPPVAGDYWLQSFRVSWEDAPKDSGVFIWTAKDHVLIGVEEHVLDLSENDIPGWGRNVSAKLKDVAPPTLLFPERFESLDQAHIFLKGKIEESRKGPHHLVRIGERWLNATRTLGRGPW